jgi:hypothetical protein
MFYGYESEAQLRQHHPELADELIQLATTREMRVCTRGKACTGSIDGKTFMYSDGSTDEGVTLTSSRVDYGGHVFRWNTEESPQKAA